MKKSEMQVNFEKAKMIISTIKDIVKNPDDIQMYIVRECWKHLNNENPDLAYDIANESFNIRLIAGYKYLELCKACDREGEFYDIAIKDPLIHLN